MDINIIILRFLIVFVLAIVFGIERQRSHKPTGFGTFIFVAIGSCGLSIIALTLNTENPLPLLGSIVTGIGFLGAGALIRTTDRIHGFTTAASIWVFAIFGIIIGVGAYVEGLIIYGLIWVVILVDNYYEKRGIGTYQRKLVLITNKIINNKEVDRLLPKKRLLSIEIKKDSKQLILTYLIQGTKEELNLLPKVLYDQEWFGSCHLE